MTDIIVDPDPAPATEAGWKRVLSGRQPLSRRIFWTTSLALCLVGLALRLAGLSSTSFWLDETYSAWFSALPLGELWRDVPLYETHPPLYYTLLKAWAALFGTSEAGLRSLSVMASVATILLLAVSGRLLRAGEVGDRVSLLAALLLAVNSGAVFFGKEARPYALETLTASLAVVFSLMLLQTIRRQRAEAFSVRTCLPATFGLGVTAGATLWLHNTALFIAFGIWTGLIASILLAGAGNRIKGLVVAALAGLLALLVWAPFLSTFIAQSQAMATMPFWITMHAQDVWAAWILIAGGRIAFFPVAAAAAFGLAALWRADRPLGMHVTAILFLPLTSVLAISFAVKPIFIDRLFEWMTPLAMALVSLAIVRGSLSPTIRAGLAATIIILSLAIPSHLNTRLEDWRGQLNAIAADAEPGDLVIATPAEITPAIHYYTKNLASFPDILHVPGPFPFRVAGREYIGNLGSPKIEPADVIPVRDALQSHKRVWLVQREPLLYDPDRIVLQQILATRKLRRVYQQWPIAVGLFE